MDRVKRVILITLGAGAWVPVIYQRHVLHRHMGFLQIAPFLVRHLLCMGTLLFMRMKKRSGDE